MEQVMTFGFRDFAVRAVAGTEGVWFVAKDVAGALGIEWRGYATIVPLEEDEKGSVVVETPGGPQTLLTVSESGLYALIFQSRKPEARRFRRWVTNEVLPQIRKTGRYDALEEEIRRLEDEEREARKVFASASARLRDAREKALREFSERIGVAGAAVALIERRGLPQRGRRKPRVDYQAILDGIEWPARSGDVVDFILSTDPVLSEKGARVRITKLIARGELKWGARGILHRIK